MVRESRWRREIEVAGERLSYEVYECDARSDAERAEDARQGTLQGDLIVVIPGHWQTADSAKLLIGTSAAEGRSRVAWCVDIDPASGGDPVKAQALPLILAQDAGHLVGGRNVGQDSILSYGRDRQNAPGAAVPNVSLFGWSHGGAEALRTADLSPGLFRQVALICAAGLVDRTLWEMIPSFVIECLAIAGYAVLRGNDSYRRRVVAIVLNIAGGIYRDLIRARSPRRVAVDVWWATRNVPGPAFRYDGDVAIIFGADDRVIRWRDVCPECTSPQEVAGAVEQLRQRDFPCVHSLQVQVLAGNHLSPDTDAAFARTALELTGLARRLSADD